MINDLHQQGLSISAIARKVGCDRKTVKKYIERGLEVPRYGPRASRGSLLDPYMAYLTERVAAFPDLSGRRLLREIKALGYEGSYSSLKPFLRDVRPPTRTQFERRFETPPGQQAQVDFAEFTVEFTDEPGVTRKVWLFSVVLGHSRWLWGRFVSSQNLQSVMRCHIAAFDGLPMERHWSERHWRTGGSPEHILYDRMKTAVIGEDEAGVVTYNTSLVALLNHYGTVPRACQPYRAKTKGKVERPFRYIRQDFFLARTFRNIDDLNAQFDLWRTDIANPRTHATTLRVVDEAFAEEQPSLKPLPAIPYDAVLTVERRVSHEGMISVAGNYYSVPDTTRKRMLEVQNHTHEVRIFEDGVLVARHPVLEGKNQRRVRHRSRTHGDLMAHSRASKSTARSPQEAGESVRHRAQIFGVLRCCWRAHGRTGGIAMTEVLDRIRGAMVGLKMPRALEALDHTISRLEQGEITAIEAIDGLLSEEYSTRETRRIDVALRTSKLLPIKTLESFDFSFQPSLDRERIAALAQLDFIRRAEVVHFPGPPSPLSLGPMAQQ